MMKSKLIAASICAFLCITSLTNADNISESVYAKAKNHSHMIIACTVLDEGPLGDGTAIQKAYKVKITRDYWSDLHMRIKEPFWIYYDSREYPDELKSGREPSYHTGDQFIAFLDFASTNKQFKIVRTDSMKLEAQIAELIEKQKKSEPAH